MFESIIVRLLHLLAHHPNFSLDVQDLRITSKYIEFYMDCVANNENVSLLYYLAGQLKTVRDAESQNDSEVKLSSFDLRRSELICADDGVDEHVIIVLAFVCDL